MEMEREEDERQCQEQRPSTNIKTEPLPWEPLDADSARRGRSLSAVEPSGFLALSAPLSMDSNSKRVRGVSLELRRALSEESTAKPPGQDTRKGAATANLAKFKEEQDLRIQTENLTQRSSKKSDSSESSNFTTPGTDTSSTGATPKVPPSSTGKKRRRRTAAQIDRKYSCTHPGCTKAYGSEGSLTQHQRLKHRQPAVENATPSQLKSMFLPLHRPNQTPSGLNATKNITIRPAGTGVETSPPGMPVASATSGLTPPFSPYSVNPGLPQNDPSSTTSFYVASSFADSTAAEQRQNLRLRSNSMPVSYSGACFAAGVENALPVVTVNSPVTTPRPQSTRRPRAMTITKARRNKSRSKSESVLKGAQSTASSSTSTLSSVADVTSISESGPDASSMASVSHPLSLCAPNLSSLFKSENSSSSSSSCSSFQEYKSTLENSPSAFNWATQSPALATAGMTDTGTEHSPMRTPEDDIDSEILSVLANDTSTESAEVVAEADPCRTATSRSRMDADMMPNNYKWTGYSSNGSQLMHCRSSGSADQASEPYRREPMPASSAPVTSAFDPSLWNPMAIPSNEPQPQQTNGTEDFTAAYDSDWIMSNDAVHLTNHLERMSMVPSNNTTGYCDARRRESTNYEVLVDAFPPIPMDPFGLEEAGEVDMELIDSNEPATNPFWTDDITNDRKAAASSSRGLTWAKDATFYPSISAKDGPIYDNRRSLSLPAPCTMPEASSLYKSHSHSEYEHPNQLEVLDDVLWGSSGCASFGSNQHDL